MSSRSEHSTHSPGAPGASGPSSASGAPGAPRRAPRASAAHSQRPPARYEPYLDGLFTYCLSVLCEHDAATAALGEALAVAERQHGRGRGRVAAEGDLRRPWLYALARWACLRKLAERRKDPKGPADQGDQRDQGDERDRGERGDHRNPEVRGSSGSPGPTGSPGAPGGGARLRAAPGPGGIEKRVGGRPRPLEVPAQRRHRDRRAPAAAASSPPVSPTAAQRRRELAALAWPEAAGTTPEQREALELAVRHRLSPSEVAAALGKERDETRALLASAACEVERTRAALAVVELGHCPVVARLAGDTQVLFSAALRRELVRHVDDCRECRGMAERATAGGPWPGTAGGPPPPPPLPVLEAPRAAVHAAMVGAQRARPARAASRPRFDRRGFPLDPKDQAARRSRTRSRVLTTTVVASVVAAPLLALWAAYRGAPTAGDDHDTDSVAAANADGAAERTPDRPGGVGGEPTGGSYGQAGSAQDRSGSRLKSRRDGTAGKQSPDVSVEVVGGDADRNGDGYADGAGGAKGDRYGDGEAERSGTSAGGRPGPHTTPSTPGSGGRPGPGRTKPGPGRLTVEAQPSGEVTVITLRASGGAPVRWSASAGAAWLQLNHTAGVLRPGETTTITVSVDRDREPPGHWRARVGVDPAGAVVVIEGRGAEPEPTPEPSDPPGGPAPTSGDTPPAPADTP
ncbi:BACON domain-containing protein [Streptomyces bingchenggensis]|nr:hypothetical protein [Streptomyces bingchenggensis]